MHYPYPPQFPVAEATELAGYLRGNPPPLNHGVHCGWVVGGYAASQVLPCDDGHNPPVGNALAAPEATLTASEAADWLDQIAAKSAAGPEAMQALPIPWKTLAKYALEFATSLILKYLE